ncbi:hypothetical protein PYCCODRAFT_1306261 [Trametes coccinea BRFM310]|uniref:Uncharacterized protein n=1 Tax=Trametes coccinea (strain BRFM310) TaxID=1353009 RepID=A0A1Y2I5S4_TRAC3|nr:hypothetical protein PYCCODRAFT_1306261 [Trametes coccinea BRFM310]
MTGCPQADKPCICPFHAQGRFKASRSSPSLTPDSGNAHSSLPPQGSTLPSRPHLASRARICAHQRSSSLAQVPVVLYTCKQSLWLRTLHSRTLGDLRGRRSRPGQNR